jgi:hypothetical protein
LFQSLVTADTGDARLSIFTAEGHEASNRSGSSAKRAMRRRVERQRPGVRISSRGLHSRGVRPDRKQFTILLLSSPKAMDLRSTT